MNRWFSPTFIKFIMVFRSSNTGRRLWAWLEVSIFLWAFDGVRTLASVTLYKWMLQLSKRSIRIWKTLLHCKRQTVLPPLSESQFHFPCSGLAGTWHLQVSFYKLKRILFARCLKGCYQTHCECPRKHHLWWNDFYHPFSCSIFLS